MREPQNKKRKKREREKPSFVNRAKWKIIRHKMNGTNREYRINLAKAREK